MGEDLSAVDLTLITALASGASQREAAARAGISQAAVWKKLQDPSFAAQVQAAKDEAGDVHPELSVVYEALARTRASLRSVQALDSTGVEMYAEEAVRSLNRAIEFLEEWAWVLEQE